MHSLDNPPEKKYILMSDRGRYKEKIDKFGIRDREREKYRKKDK